MHASMRTKVRLGALARARIYLASRWVVFIVFCAVVVEIPVGVAAIVLASQGKAWRPSADSPAASVARCAEGTRTHTVQLVFTRYGGVVAIVLALSSLADAHLAIRARRTARTLNALRIEHSTKRDAHLAVARAASGLKPLVIIANAVRELTKLAVLVWLGLGLFSLYRCWRVDNDIRIVNAALVVLLGGAVNVWLAVEALSAMRLGFFWYEDVAPSALGGEARAIADAEGSSSSAAATSSSAAPAAVEIGSTGEAHRLLPASFAGAVFCNVCTHQIHGIGLSGLQCDSCGYATHRRCADKADANCKQTWSSETDAPLAHHWVRGNCPGLIAATCLVCHASTASYKALRHFRCAWCHATVHDACSQAVSPRCTLGRLARLIVPPSAVRTEGPDESLVFAPAAGHEPLLVLVNVKAGGRQGERLLPLFRQLVNPAQVFDLTQGGPGPGLRACRLLPRFSVVCAGGDGTVGWILQTLDKMQLRCKPPVAVIPLGTGNDLARSLGWGGGYEGEPIADIMLALAGGAVFPMDRWMVSVTGGAAGGLADPNVKVLNNYFSLGLDAALALRFHLAREAAPEKFNSRLYNKYYYGRVGAQQMLCGCGTQRLDTVMRLAVDGAAVELPKIQGLMVLNLPSYAAGCDFWGKPKPSSGWAHSAIDDATLEVVGVRSVFHLGRVTSKKRFVGTPFRIAQGKAVTIELDLANAASHELAMQLDGEPWSQQVTRITITRHNQAFMLTHATRAIARVAKPVDPTDLDVASAATAAAAAPADDVSDSSDSSPSYDDDGSSLSTEHSA